MRGVWHTVTRTAAILLTCWLGAPASGLPADGEAGGSASGPSAAGSAAERTQPGPANVTPADFLANWMGYMQPVFKNQPLFAMNLAGTHDTLTYDLVALTADAAKYDTLTQPALEAIQKLPGGRQLIGEVSRPLAIAQTLTVSQQLDAGARFLDIRVTWEPEKEDWYGYHTVLTAHDLSTYLAEIRDWLAAHPTELVVIWLSFHGETCPDPSGPTFKGAATEQYARLASDFERAFGEWMVDPRDSRPPSESTYAEVLGKGRRVLLYAVDRARFPAGFRAFDSCPAGGAACSSSRCPVSGAGGMCQCSWDDVTNLGPGRGVARGFSQYLSTFENARSTRATWTEKNNLQVVTAGASAPSSTDFIMAQVTLARGWPYPVYHQSATNDCRTGFNLPARALSRFKCPADLAAISRLVNFYLQRSVDYALRQQRDSPGWGLPMVLYLDQLLADGTIDTGKVPYDGSADSSKYAVVAALLSAAAGWLPCDDSDAARAYPAFSCADIESTLAALLSAAQYATYEDLPSGRLANWPPYPGDRPPCAPGYREKAGKCYQKPPEKLQDSLCKAASSCSGPLAMCSDGWIGSCHGNCPWGIVPLKCYENCVVDATANMKTLIESKVEHENGDVATYFVCPLTGSGWQSLEKVMGLPSIEDYQYNVGGAGTRDTFNCTVP